MHELGRGVQQRQLLLLVAREIAVLQAPLHVDAVAHDTRVGARRVEQHAIVAQRQVQVR